MRQSNGSNFFLNRKDIIVKNGYLNKKSMSSVLSLFTYVQYAVFWEKFLGF